MDKIEIKKFETFSSLKIPEQSYFVLRLDGRNFNRLEFKKPFDSFFYYAMEGVALNLAKEFNPSYVYFQSDEVNLLFSRDYNLFNRRLEKLVSLSSSKASSFFTLLLKI